MSKLREISTYMCFVIRIVVFDSWQISTSSQNGLNKAISSTVLHCVPHEMINPYKENTETITTKVHPLCRSLFQYDKIPPCLLALLHSVLTAQSPRSYLSQCHRWSICVHLRSNPWRASLAGVLKVGFPRSFLLSYSCFLNFNAKFGGSQSSRTPQTTHRLAESRRHLNHLPGSPLKACSESNTAMSSLLLLLNKDLDLCKH